jgi:hypothetical protein
MGIAGVHDRAATIADGMGWRGFACTWAAIIACAVGYFVWRIPVQVTDCLANLIIVSEQTWRQALTESVGQGFMRPMLWVQIKAMYEIALGHYTLVFRSIHVLQVVACGLLFVGALRVRDVATAMAVPFGVAMLFGGHTFDGTVREAFPINSFLTVVIASFAALNLSRGAPSRWKDIAAVGLLAAVLLTVESGVVVWVCLVAGWMAGATGVSRRAVVVATACLGLYLVTRFAWLAVGTPDLLERPSGFGFHVLEAAELKNRFGAAPWRFYAYNVASQIFTVLFSEPRLGVWAFTRDLLNDEVTRGQWIAVLTSVGATIVIGRYFVRRAASWLRRDFDDRDRIVLVSVAVLFANAVVSFPYTKTVIVSAAGAMYALAATVALADLISRQAIARPPILAVTAVFIALLTAGASVRLIGMCYNLREAAFVTRNEWTEVDAWADRNHIDLSPPRRAALVKTLRNDAITHRVPAPAFADPDYSRYFY